MTLSAVRDAAFDDWIERARRISVREELTRRGLWSRKMLGDAGNPCPGCGGVDRFAVNLKKNLFVCRASGAGGDAIALVRHIDGVAFARAVEILTGEPPPAGGAAETPAERAARAARHEAQARAQAETARRQQAEGERYRAMERRAAFDLWLAGKPLDGTPAAVYLALRGLVWPPEAQLKFAPECDYYASSREYDTRESRAWPIWRGPALLAAIRDARGAFIGLHRTWIDLDRPKGLALITDPQTGAALPSKKMRGSKRGGLIHLAGHPGRRGAPRAAWRMMLGEGIETTLSVFTALPVLEHVGTEFCAAGDLGNMAGKAAARVPHPSETRIVRGKGGRARTCRVFVPDDVPADDDDTPLIGLPDALTELVLLGDGDSEPVRTRLALQRAATRYADAYPGLTVKCAMARADSDFNAMLMEAV